MDDDEDYSWWGPETWGCVVFALVLWVGIGVVYVLVNSLAPVIP